MAVPVVEAPDVHKYGIGCLPICFKYVDPAGMKFLNSPAIILNTVSLKRQCVEVVMKQTFLMDLKCQKT